MKLIKGVFCYLIAFNMAQLGQCPFEECEGYYENIEGCKKCVEKFYDDKNKTKLIILPRKNHFK